MIWNLGSINIDNVYQVSNLPVPGETLAALSYSQGLGGKGANMSIAVARAGVEVKHIGAIGKDGEWTRDRLSQFGVNTDEISVLETATGHANICVDPDGENNIVLFAGANQEISEPQKALTSQDILLLQNETNGQVFAAKSAKAHGAKVVYAAAPFDVGAVQEILPFVDLLVLNAVEAKQLSTALSCDLADLNVADIVVTLGGDGCKWVSNTGEKAFSAYPATPVDTTGAGDTFTGYLVAGLDQGQSMKDAIDLALKAGALMVSRHGTGDVIPTMAEITKAF